jgi:hypothetical protein
MDVSMPDLFSVAEEFQPRREFILASWYASRFATNPFTLFVKIICSQVNRDWEEL